MLRSPRATEAKLDPRTMERDVRHAVCEVLRELNLAVAAHGDFKSVHEGYAVILEELDELWEEVRKRRGKRDLKAMRREAIQIAAMGLKFALFVKE